MRTAPSRAAQDRPLVAVLAEAGPGRGLGHQRRAAAIARALEQCGADPVLAAADDPDPVPPGAEVVVVDAYTVRADEPRFRPGGVRLVAAIEDLGRDLEVDVVVDPAPWPGPHPYTRAGRVLAGLDHALVEAPRTAPPPARDPVSRVLVGVGASDSAGVGARIASELADLLPAAEVVHAAGPWSATVTHPRVTTLTGADGLDEVLASADLVVAAGGVTMLEALVLGRPTVVVPVADNQARQTAAVSDAGAAVVVEARDVDGAIRAAVDIAGDAPRRRALARRAAETVDGGGPARVAEVLLGLR